MSYKITAEQVVALGPCGLDDEDDGTNYTPEQVRRLFKAAGLTEASAVDILCLGPELDIPAQDLLWLVLRPEFIEPTTAAKFALLCAEHVEEHSEAAQRCNAVTRRFLAGEATLEELEIARAAIMDADEATWAAGAAGAATEAARVADEATGVARAAAWVADRASTGDAEAEWQCETLLSLLRGTSDE